MGFRSLCLLAASVLVFGCGDDGDGDDGKVSPLDPNVAPITEGGWYRPALVTSWQWQLVGTVNTTYDVDIYDIDLFDSSESLISQLQADGRMVICYFSAGSSEDWRSDFSKFSSEDMGETLDGWEDERWLDVRSANVHSIMQARLDLAVQKGCDGVEPDNMDGYSNDSGFSMSATDQKGFNRFIANAAHTRGLSVGLKNSGDQAPELVAYYDFEVNEQCHQYDECDQLQPFIDADKPVFNAEYTDEDTYSEAQAQSATVCPAAVQGKIRTLFLPLDLDDSFRLSCDD